MIYKITLFVVRVLLVIFNGVSSITGRERLPQNTGYVVVSPHRSLLDPPMIAIAIYPKPVVVMAKKELFKNKLFGKFISILGAFPVDREKPSPSVIKHPVTKIKEEQRSLIIFPTGTRYSNDMKGGAVTIARMANVPIVPIVYQGPFTFLDLFKRKKMHVRIGEPIYLEKKRLTKEEIATYDEQILASFEQLDREINPDFVYKLPEKKKS